VSWTAARILILALLIAGVALWSLYSGRKPAPAPRAPPAAVAPAPPPPQPTSADCREVPGFEDAARANALSAATLAWSPWGRAEVGWETYAPLIGREIGAPCPAGSTAFAAALARWQAGARLPGGGTMSPATFEALRVTWLKRRPFVEAMARGCPAPASPDALVAARPEEGYGGKLVSLRAGALSAYRRLVEAARRETAEAAADHTLLSLISGFRAPTPADQACLSLGGCGNLARANCSAHRTGLAADLFVGAAPGHDPASSDDVNRLFQSRTSIYRWLAANAARFGFVPYPFEPWHWEWTGEAP
jgi:hypothetical protein